MARTLGEAVGETVGLRVRLGSKVGRRTRIEVVTEGVFTRMILDDPALEGVAACSSTSSTSARSTPTSASRWRSTRKAALREDLRLLVMSATLDGARVAAAARRRAGDRIARAAPIPVETRYLGRDPRRRIEDAGRRRGRCARCGPSRGSILVFLPGQGEIRRVETLLRERIADPAVDLAPLYGALDRAEQDRAVAPAPRRAAARSCSRPPSPRPR